MFAWAGGALFAASLSYFAFSYVVTFAQPVTGGGGILAAAWDVTIFSVFALHHSVFARGPVRATVRSIVAASRERAFYVWVASLLFIAVCATWRPVAGVLWVVEHPALVWLLRLLQAAGVYLTLRSAAVIGVLELAGVRESRPSNFSTVGPYGWVRHPIYSGWFLIVFAASPMTMTRFVFAVISSGYLLVAIPFEERSLLASASSGYERYQQQVRWKLLPGVY